MSNVITVKINGKDVHATELDISGHALGVANSLISDAQSHLSANSKIVEK